jgi:hypothetical protein
MEVVGVQVKIGRDMGKRRLLGIVIGRVMLEGIGCRRGLMVVRGMLESKLSLGIP